jgi:spermidine/putrescine-binding protein
MPAPKQLKRLPKPVRMRCMRKTLLLTRLLWAGCLLVVALMAGCKKADDTKVLNLYTWSDYFPKSALEGFTKKTGIKVNLTTFSTNEELMDKLGSGVSDYDLVVPSDYAVRTLILDKRLMPIDRKKIPNFSNLDPKQLGLAYDKANEFSIPYFWGTTGLGVNKSVIKDPVDSWAVVFDPRNAGKISMLKDARENFAVALKMMGKSINETDSAVLEKAAAMLAEQTKWVKLYDSDSFDATLRTGEAALVQGFNGQVAKVVAENRDKFYYVVPKEGATLWVDNLAIPAHARHSDAAHAFLNYILDPRVGGEIVASVAYASANRAARPFIPAEILNDPNIYTPDDVLKRCELMEDLGPAAPVMDKLWTKLRAK